jgi:hypothetical protein
MKTGSKVKVVTPSLYHLMSATCLFEKEGEDKFGNPIPLKNAEGNPIVKTVVPYETPYMKAEVIAMINWLNENKK